MLQGGNMSRIKTLRKEKGLTQLQVQMKLGIDQSNYSKIERGLLMPTVEQCIGLAMLFNTSIDYILEVTDIKEPYPRKI